MTLLALDVIPIINENDTVTTDEIRFGDNDTLGALVTNLIEADVLVLLTDQQGLHTADPRRDPAPRSCATRAPATRRSRRWPAATGSALGSGGMLTKVLAAKRAARSGASTVIACGREPDVLTRLAAGEAIGTLLSPSALRLPRASNGSPITCSSPGASRSTRAPCARWRATARACCRSASSRSRGISSAAKSSAVFDPDGREIARGLVNYSAQETARILRKPSSEIEAILGYVDEPELIHRDNLVLLG